MLWRAAALGYQFLARLSLAAVASLQSAGAGAGAIEGSIIFPSQLVPSMTVYAAGLDSARVHSVQLVRGQANFTVEVPPGRYLVFLAPNETGAPDVYGAFTQYSLCGPHVEGRCEDHTLVPVTVTSKAPHPAVTIDDWYLTDDVAGQIDRILGGVAAGGGARVNSELLSAPRFSEYPSAPFRAAALPKIDFSGTDLSLENRELVQRALLNGPNFAGHLTAALTTCGPACGRLVLVDWDTGSIRALPQNLPSEIPGNLPCRADEAVLFRRDSRLLYISRARGTSVVTQYYVWNQKNAALAQNTEYQRTSQTFCAVAAR
jgi:hypothetical protein